MTDQSNSDEKNPQKLSSPETERPSSIDSRQLRNRKLLIPFVGLFLIVMAGLYLLNRAPNRLPHASSEPDPMADSRPAGVDFTLTDKLQASSENQFKLSEQHGNVVLITFWSTECPTCLMELPAFNELRKRYKSDGLEVVAINLDTTPEGKSQAQELWKKGDYSFGSFFDSTRDVAKLLNVETLPSTFVIDRKGRTAFTSYGANDWRAPETARLIEDLLLEEKP